MKNSDIIRRAANNAYLRQLHKKQVKVQAEQRAAAKIKREYDSRALLNTYLDIPEDIKISASDIEDIDHNREFNTAYAEYYYMLYEETNLEILLRKSENVNNCYSFFCGDRYPMQRCFDLKRVNLCKDRFCVNCQHVRQSNVLFRFESLLPVLLEKYDVYHICFTVPNVSGPELSPELDRLFYAFRSITEYFDVKKNRKISDIDFSQYGYGGAVRNLEIVTNPDCYHPHIHGLFLFKKGLELNKCAINKYSFSNGSFKQMYSDLEILLQKLTYLLYNKQRVTAGAIASLPLGYGVYARKVEDMIEIRECFKYCTKLSKDGDPLLRYDQFKTLYYALYRRRVMQGYGLFFGLNDEEFDTAEIDDYYNMLIAKLRLVEDPEEDVRYIIDKLKLLVSSGDMSVISKRLIAKYLDKTKPPEGD